MTISGTEIRPSDPNQLNINISFKVTGTPCGLLTLSGVIDKPNLRLLRSAFDVCLSEKKKFIIIDMAEIHFVGSAGWGYFIAEQERLKQLGGLLLLTKLQPYIQKMYDSLQIGHTIMVFPSIDICYKEFQKIVESVKSDSKATVTPYTKTDAPFIKSDVPSKPDITQPKAESSDIEESTTKNVQNLKEKIVSIISEYGPCDFFSIKKYFNLKNGNNCKISTIKLLQLLKEMDLDTKAKRERFYRSC